MEKLAMCRICMIEDVRMYYLVRNLQETYAKLVAIPFEAKGTRPVQVCYMCYARLQSCHQLRLTCLQSEQLYNQMLENTVFEVTVLQDVNRLRVVHPPLIHLSIPGTLRNYTSDDNIDEDLTMDSYSVVADIDEDNEETLHPTILESTRLEKNPVNSSKCDTETKFKPNDSFVKRIQTIYRSNIRAIIYGLSRASRKCDICDKSFSSNSKLWRHLRMHSANKVYKCQLCEKRYKHKTHLLCHIHTHTDETLNAEKKYKCDICHRFFFRKGTLTSHMRTHTGVKPHKCTICEKAFADKGGLKKHIRLHTGEKPYKCKLCGSCFRQSITLTKHMRIHTGERPYKCNICDKSFTEKCNLTRHKLIHTGEKPYKCDICKKSFNQNVTLLKHYSIH